MKNIWLIATRPDNIAIIVMLSMTVFFIWLSFRKAFTNDKLLTQTGDHESDGKTAREELFVWPYLVRMEFLVALIVVIGLFAWSLALDAPLEELANPTLTPNPAKAPWYFLGLQELLVYFDPWIAGVVIPNLIILGLMAIPYLDINPKGSGYYVFSERKFAVYVFCFGFFFWVILIMIGVFMRGPGWQWFWPWQTWDAGRTLTQINKDLSEFFGVKSRSFLGMIIGVIPIAVYYGVGILLSYRYFKRKQPSLLTSMGKTRYFTLCILLLTMFALPIKIVLRLVFNLKYVLVTPWFNI